MNRRDFLQYAGYMLGAGILPRELLANMPAKQDNIVVLVHLKGGNDGFNTLVPYADANYYKLRNKIGLREDGLLKLQDGFGMHPQLKQLEPLWKSGELAWIQGVGYPHAILSHFVSLDIWETASASNHEHGWLAEVLPKMKTGLHGIVISEGIAGTRVLAGSKVNSVTMQNPGSFLKAAQRVEDVQVSRRTAAIAHVSEVQHQLYTAGREIADKIGSSPRPVAGRFAGELGHGLQAVAQMIMAGVDCPVYKVTQDGFDTHAGQLGMQSNALYQLSSGLASFARAMKQSRLWDKVLVVTYSEFGRRAQENRGAGTDHGTASAHMVLGGRVKGGFYGKHPDMARLDANGNVRHTTDFRSIYGTLAQRWWRQNNPWQSYGVIPFV